MYTTLILTVHILVAFSIIGLVLIQHGKGADAGAAFGAGAAGGVSGTVFGAQGSGNFLSRATGVLAAVFFMTSLAMAYFATSGRDEPKSLMDNSGSVMQDAPRIESSEIPAQNQPDVPADVPGAAETATMPAAGSTSMATESSVPAAVDTAPAQNTSDVPSNDDVPKSP